jgi:hypothetical protein
MAALLSCVILSAPTAMAGTAVGAWGYYGPQAGIAYRNQNTIVTGSSYAYGNIYIQTQPLGTLAPAGYMGAQARMHKDGVLCRATGWLYNSAGATSHFAATSSVPCGEGVYRAQGSSKAWTGYAYNTYASFTSPNQNYPG